jgi:hypothetical protein
VGSRSGFVVAVSLIALAGTVLYAPPALAASTPAATASVVGLADASSEATEFAARQVAVAFHHAVLVTSDTTPTEETSVQPDGTMQLVENTVPVRVKTATGWTAVDSNLKASKDGFLAPAATDAPVEFSAGGSSVLAKVQTSTGKWLEEASPFGVLPTPIVDGAVATYANVLPGVDLRLTATAGGMSEVMVIKSATAAANPALKAVQFNLSGSALSSNSGGVVTETAPDGSKVLSTAPMWWDSSDGSDANGPAGNASPEPVQQTVSNSTIALNAQAAISSRAVKYPVYVDPDTTGYTQAYTYVDQAYPTQSYWDGAYAGGIQRVGYVDAAHSSDSRTHVARSLWQVDTTAVRGSQILGATFNVNQNGAFNCTASEVDLYWSGGISTGTTWNVQPGLVQYLSDAVTGCPYGAVGFTATAAVQGAANLNATGLTLELHANNEGVNTSWKKFDQAASITIDYDNYPVVPAAPSIASPVRSCAPSPHQYAYLNSSGGVTVQANFTDPDGGNLTPMFKLYNSAGTMLSSYTPTSSDPEGTISWSIASTLLPTGNLFSWTATSSDGTLTSAASSACHFSTLNSDPDLPTISGIPAAGTVNVGQAFSVVFNSAPADHVVSFAYWWGDGSPSTTGQPPVSSQFSTTAASASYPADGSSTSVTAADASSSLDGSVRIAAANSSGSSASIQVAAIDDTSTLYVTAYDAAGNESHSGTAYSTGDEVFANPSSTVNYTSGHEWSLDGLTSATSLPNPVPDANATTGIGLTSKADLTLGSAVDPSTTDDPDALDTIPVFHFTGEASPTVADIAATSGPTVDTTQSFTVTAWADPAAPPTSGFGTLISQSGTTNSGFVLGIASSGQWAFCAMSQVSGALACAYSQSTAALSSWTEVTGIWDSVNQQVRLLVGNTMVGPATAHSLPTGDSSASGPLTIGSALFSGTRAFQWNGEIDDPAIFPGIIDEDQLSVLAGFHLIS